MRLQFDLYFAAFMFIMLVIYIIAHFYEIAKDKREGKQDHRIY